MRQATTTNSVDCLVIGAGVVGSNALQMAVGLGAPLMRKSLAIIEAGAFPSGTGQVRHEAIIDACSASMTSCVSPSRKRSALLTLRR